ncbi:MAG: glycosyltransferase family 4 protein [Lachnospiraceae bacterium]|nr:glycosyltransferase family 4 protein [Lachnospiraceae bacterium]
MKIAHICLVGGYTEGLNYQENNLIKYQAKDGHEVSLITTDHCYTEGVWGLCTTETDYINPDGVHIIRLPFAFPLPYNVNRQIGIFKGFKDTLERIRPDIIFVHNLQFQDNRKVASYKRKHPEVVVYADNHSDFSNSARNWFSRNTLYRFWWKPCAKAVEPYVKKFFGVMPSRVDFLQNIYGISADKTDLLIMGADDESVERAAKKEIHKEVREKYGLQPEDFLIVTGGKIDAFKTQTLLLMQAVQEIPREHLKLLVFGSIEEELKEKLLALCDGKKIQYIGWAKGEQSYEYFAAADLVVFPGRHSIYWEQVAAQGIPMICKYWEGTTHVDIGGNVEFLMEDSVEVIKEKILELLDHPEKYEQMKKSAGSDGRNAFSYRLIARKSVGLTE